MVPKGWITVELETLCAFASGNTPSKSNESYWGGEFPWVTAKDLKHRCISDSELRLTSAGRSKAKITPANTILILTRGMGLFKGLPIGITTRDIAFNQDIKALSPKGNNWPEFVYYILSGNASRIRNLVDQAGHGTGRLDTTRLKHFPVLRPSGPEQKKIARILSTWDKAIETVEKLIENSTRQKKAIMQQLLTGKMRLTGFSGEWNNHKLSNIATIKVSNVDKKSAAGEIPVRLCNYTDVYYNDFITNKIEFMEATASAQEIEKFALQPGDVLITKDSETPDDIAVPAIVDEELENTVCGYHLALIRPKAKKCCGEFIALLLSLPKTRYHFSTLANGATRFGLSVSSITDAELLVPGVEEQRAIAQRIRSVSETIIGLNEDLIILQKQKKALMQQLLTGKRRVKVDDIDRTPVQAG